MKKSIVIIILAMMLSMLFNLPTQIIEGHAAASVTPGLTTQGGNTVSINDVSVMEGNADSISMIFTVTLTAPGEHPSIGVQYATADGLPPAGATTPSDYTSVANLLVFPGGMGGATMTISVPINGDTAVEPDETFFVNLSIIDSPATLTDGQGAGTIINDDTTCSYSILPTSNSFVREGGTGVVNVTAPAGCNWTAVSNAPWITVTSGASGSGNGTVNYSVAVNTGDFREGIITIAGQTFSIRQVGCVNSLTPFEQNFPSSGGTGSIAVSADASCNWTVVSQEPWITITSSANGSGNGTVTYSVASHSGTTRIGRIRIGGVSFNVLQDGLANCTFSISPTEQLFPYNPLASAPLFNHVMITGPSSCTWTARSNVDWIKTAFDESGIGNGTATYTVEDNPGPPRIGTLTIAGQTFTVIQGRCPLSLEVTRKDFPFPGGTGEISVLGDCPFTAVSNADWITITEVDQVTNTIKYTVAENPGVFRLGTISVDDATFEVAQFTQGSCSISIDPSDDTFSASGLGTRFAVGGQIFVLSPPGCNWTARTNANWITLTAGATGSGDGIIQYSVMPNTTGRSRPATIEIRNEALTSERTFSINQQAALPPCVQAISPEIINLDGTPASVEVQVTAPPDCRWEPIAHAPWIKGTDDRGFGNGRFTYGVDKNPGGVRSSIIDIGGKIHHVTQNVGNCPVETICQLFPTGCEGTELTARNFRDQVLVERHRGKRYTELYYKFSTEAVGIMMLNPMLLLRSRDMMARYMPVVQSMIKGEQVALTSGDLEEIDNFLNTFAARGSAEFRATIHGLREDLYSEQVHREFSITITEGERRDLPARASLPFNKQTRQILPPLGFFLLFYNLILRRRRKLRFAFRRLICATLIFSVLGCHWFAVSGKMRTSGWRLITSKSLENQTAQANQIYGKVPDGKVPDGSMPLGFEANYGQCDSRVKFISRGAGYNLLLSASEATFQLRKTNCGLEKKITTDYVGKTPIPNSAIHLPQSEVVQMKLVGANPDAKLQGLDKQPSLSNYFIGKDPANWRTAVPNFAKVRYENIYNGIDLIYYGNPRDLEYDFKLAPGASSTAIRLSFEGADKLEIDRHSDLVLHVADREVRQRKPLAYQTVDGRRREIACRYTLIENPKSKTQNPMVGFEIGDFDTTRPLIIDPVMVYSTYFGGAGNDEGNSITIDGAGNVYVAGLTDSINFPGVNSAQPMFGGGAQDAFVLKLDPTGTRVVYATYLGGNGQDNATSIALDAAGNPCVTGFTESTDFPIRNALQAAKNGNFNTFVTKLNGAGALLNSTLLGGSASDYGSSIAVDATGNMYVAGLATSADFPMANAMQPQSGGAVDLYLAKIDASGSRLLYSTYLGGSGIDATSSIAIDSAGNLYVTGLTSSRDFRTVNALQTSHGGGLFDAFVMKLNASGNEDVYATYLGGSGEDRSLRIAVDHGGSAYVTGDTDSTNFPVKNAVQQASGGSADVFVSKVNPSGSALTYSTYLGGSGVDGGTAIAIDAMGSASVTGFTASANFPTVNSLQQRFGGGGFDGFVAKLNASGSALNYSTYLGSNGIDSGFGIAADVSGNTYVMGVTTSTTFPTVAPLQPTNGGGTADIFIARIKSGPSVTGALKSSKNLVVTGSGFDIGATIFVNGEPQKTSNDSQSPTTMLIGKKTFKKIAPGQAVTLQVRNADGTLSNEFRFTRP